MKIPVKIIPPGMCNDDNTRVSLTCVPEESGGVHPIQGVVVGDTELGEAPPGDHTVRVRVCGGRGHMTTPTLHPLVPAWPSVTLEAPVK